MPEEAVEVVAAEVAAEAAVGAAEAGVGAAMGATVAAITEATEATVATITAAEATMMMMIITEDFDRIMCGDGDLYSFNWLSSVAYSSSYLVSKCNAICGINKINILTLVIAPFFLYFLFSLSLWREKVYFRTLKQVRYLK